MNLSSSLRKQTIKSSFHLLAITISKGILAFHKTKMLISTSTLKKKVQEPSMWPWSLVGKSTNTERLSSMPIWCLYQSTLLPLQFPTKEGTNISRSGTRTMAQDTKRNGAIFWPWRLGQVLLSRGQQALSTIKLLLIERESIAPLATKQLSKEEMLTSGKLRLRRRNSRPANASPRGFSTCWWTSSKLMFMSSWITRK